MQVADYCAGKPPTTTAKTVYMSLPRPGKHGTTSKAPPAVKLTPEEQTKILKAGSS